LIIFKSLFYRNKDIFKFYYFLVSLGAFAASVAIYFYLIGNPDFMILKNKISRGSATGFFINRTVFSCFLTLCFFSGIEYLKKIDDYKKDNTDKFFNKIYVRIFILLITIGIITTFSKLGNFLFISIVILYILQAFFINDKKSKFFLITLILIVLVDILILGFYFGSEKLLQRYLFLQNDIIEYLPSAEQSFLSRADIVKFALVVSKKFVFWGYGGGGFEYLFKINFENLSTVYASHVHSDIIEFIGEFGLIGFTLILLSLLFSCIKKNFFSFKNILLLYLLLFILIFDFSFHIPLIQLLFILLLSMNYNKSYILSRKNNE
jgi:O-antigen ligase